MCMWDVILTIIMFFAGGPKSITASKVLASFGFCSHCSLCECDEHKMFVQNETSINLYVFC